MFSQVVAIAWFVAYCDTFIVDDVPGLVIFWHLWERICTLLILVIDLQ